MTPPHHHDDGFAVKSRENRDRLRAQDKASRSTEEERQRRLNNKTDGDGSQRRCMKISNIHRVFIAEINRGYRRRLRAQDKAMRDMDSEKQRRIILVSTSPSKIPPIMSSIHRVFMVLGGVGQHQGERVRARDKAIQLMEHERQRRIMKTERFGAKSRQVSNIQRVSIAEAAYENRERLRAQHIALLSMEEERQRRIMAVDSEMMTSSAVGVMTNLQRVFITEVARDNRQRIRAKDEAIQGMEEERIRRIDRMMVRHRHIPRAFVCRVLPQNNNTSKH